LLTSGEILQLPRDEALVLVSGLPPIRASKLRYYADRNFLLRRRAPPRLAPAHTEGPRPRAHDWTGHTRGTHPNLDNAWSELVSADAGREVELEPRPGRTPDRFGERSIRQDPDANLWDADTVLNTDASDGASRSSDHDDDLIPV
jgi:type IV secretion system protein VirD4